MMASTDAQVTLHWLNGSRAQGTLWLLEELQVPYEIKVYHRQRNKLAPPDLEKVHPLGKSPVVTIHVPGAAQPMVLAESAFIVQYLSEHYPQANNLVPKRWKDGQEGQLFGETEAWMRYQYLMYSSEGSMMPQFVTYYICQGLSGSSVPFFLRPLTSIIAKQLASMTVVPNLKRYFALLENLLDTSPDGGKYICGPQMTGADIMLAYPLITGCKSMFNDMDKWSQGSFKATYPKLYAYSERLENEAGFQRSVEKVKAMEVSFSLLP